MEEWLMPAIAAAAAGGLAWPVSGNGPVALGAAFGSALGLWLTRKWRRPRG